MKPDPTMHKFLKALFLSVSVGSLFYVIPVHADVTIPTLDQVIVNISNNLQNLTRLSTAIAYVLGLYFVIAGVIELKHFGEMRTMMSQEHGIKKPIIYFFVGGALIYLPSSINAGLNTLFTSPFPYQYPVDTTDAWSKLQGAIYVILQLIGIIAFIRGLVILTSLGGHGGQQGNFMKGLMHIIGGILCINMYDTVTAILNTLGMSSVFS